MRADPPTFVTTIGRGSSAHACSYGAYMATAKLGVPAFPLPPSMVTLFASPLRMAGGLTLAVSQSGRSTDIVAALGACSAAGADTVAFVNDADSPLALLARTTCPLHAGPELSVAATKTFITTLAALARFVGHWAGDASLLDGLKSLPEVLETAQSTDLSPLVDLFGDRDRVQRALILGRGPGWPTALEAALKLKEACSLQAEAFTSAEVKHGPMALVGEGYPILMFATRGPAMADLIATAAEMRKMGATVFLMATDGSVGADLVLPGAADPWLDPLVIIQAFHLAAERIARARGLDPDSPPHLNKVTLTL